MKLLTLCLLLCVSVTLLGDTKPSEFKLTVTITYPSVTLEEAAKIEKMLRKVVPDSCEVKLNMGEVQKVGVFHIEVDSTGISPKPWYWGVPNLKLYNDAPDILQ